MAILGDEYSVCAVYVSLLLLFFSLLLYNYKKMKIILIFFFFFAINNKKYYNLTTRKINIFNIFTIILYYNLK